MSDPKLNLNYSIWLLKCASTLARVFEFGKIVF